MFNPYVKLMKKDKNGNMQQVFPETDVNSIIGLGDSKGDLLDRIAKLEEKVQKLENHVLY